MSRNAPNVVGLTQLLTLGTDTHIGHGLQVWRVPNDERTVWDCCSLVPYKAAVYVSEIVLTLLPAFPPMCVTVILRISPRLVQERC